MRKILLLLPFFLWTCSEGPTEPKAPLAYNLSLTTNEDTPLTFTFEDISSSESITFERTTRNGSLNVTGDIGTYVPNENWFGTDTFQYIVTNKNGLNSNTGYGTIIVNPINDTPTVPEEPLKVINIQEGYPTINITLDGDDIENDALSFNISKSPNYGQVNIDGNIAYYQTTVDNFDSFKYQACQAEDCSIEREVILKIDWGETFFDVKHTIQNDNGDYLYFDRDYTWILSKDGTDKTNFLSNYGRDLFHHFFGKISKFNNDVIVSDNFEIFKTNSNLDGNIEWVNRYEENHNGNQSYSFDINSQGIFSGIQSNEIYGDIYFSGRDFSGNELFKNLIKYKFTSPYHDNVSLFAMRSPRVAVNDNYVYGYARIFYRYEEKQFQTYAGQTSFSMVEDENQKYDLYVEYVKIDISNSEALGPDIQDTDINKTHYVPVNNFSDGSSGTENNRYKLIDSNYDTNQNNGDGGTNTIINATWLEGGTDNLGSPILLKMDFEGNVLEVSDLYHIEPILYSDAFGRTNSILAFNNEGPIVLMIDTIYKFSDNIIDVEWTISGVNTHTKLAKLNENEFIYSSDNDLVKVDINGGVVWSTKIYDTNIYEEGLDISGYLFIDSENNILVQGIERHIMKFDTNGNRIF
jgi:hypothetical protein